MTGWLQRLFGPRYKEPKGVLLYDTVQEVILVHKMLAAQRFAVRLVAPPPEFRIGCDLAVEFELLEQEALENAIAQSGFRPIRTVSVKEMLPGVLKESAFVSIEGFLMCKAGNMKITVDKDHRIVNISGGGCPDIPYVAQRRASLGKCTRSGRPGKQPMRPDAPGILRRSQVEAGNSMIVLMGTVPCETGVYIGNPELSGGYLVVGGAHLPVGRGTAAMAAACAQVCRFYGLPPPLCVLGGDIADGKGTAMMFAQAEAGLERYDASVIVLHYLFPKLAYAAPFMEKLNGLPLKPQLIADAGGMYLLKAAKKSRLVDVYTPDLAELAFLADEFAPHPLYVKDLSPATVSVDSLVTEAYRHSNAAQTLVVKGPVDYVYRGTTRIGTCDRPNIPAMEAVGGTGDTITGMIAALRFRREESPELKALLLNRLAGELVGCTPATQINEFVDAIPTAIDRHEKRTT